MAEGRSNTAIAESLVVTPGAVEKHITNIFAKLDLPACDDDHGACSPCSPTCASPVSRLAVYVTTSTRDRKTPEMVADVLARVRAEIDAAWRELRPAVAEYEQLLVGYDALDIQARAAVAPSPPARSPACGKNATGGRSFRAVKARPPAKAASAAKAPRAVKVKAPRAAKGSAAAAMGATEQAIVAALEHGSHTVGELDVVTAMSGGEIRESARRLLQAGKIARAKREGKPAYALRARRRRLPRPAQ